MESCQPIRGLKVKKKKEEEEVDDDHEEEEDDSYFQVATHLYVFRLRTGVSRNGMHFNTCFT